MYYRNKSKVEMNMQTNVIYSIKCSCDGEYVGMTTRKFGTRIKEHKNCASTKSEVSGITEHFRDTGHQVVSYDVIDRGRFWTDLRIREGIHVASRKPALNKNDSYVINDCWISIL